MRQGGILLVTAAVLACTACLGGKGKFEVRSSSGGLKAGHAPVPFRIAEARGHFALGNIALALEGFRKAAREDPASVDALAGIAACYDQMERFDLSRRHYEMALAVAPRNPTLLGAFAGSLDRQGLAAEAASVRREMAALAQSAAPAPLVAAVAPANAPAAPSVPVIAAASAPAPAAPDAAAPVGRSVTIALPPPRPVGTTHAPPTESRAMAAAPIGRSVTIALPPPRPVGTTQAPPAEPRAMAVAPVGRTVTIALPPPRPAPAAGHRQPRLERLSLNEVALVIGDGPRWKKTTVQPLRVATRIAPSKALEVRLLNAARVDKLAARTRSYLGRFGWRDIAVGDAAAVRPRSLIVYPQGTQAAAKRLAARLGFAMAERPNVKQVTILLGRDAAAHPGMRPRA